MRVEKTVKNVILALLCNSVNIILGIVIQAIFIRTINEEYLGLNTLLSSILSMLAIAELGIASAIIYNLYKYIQEDNKEKIKSLMNFYKKCYTVIIIVMLGIGLAIMPFLELIIGDNNVDNIYLLYILFLADVIFSYTIAYKRAIIYANQKEYITNFIHLLYIIVMNVLQIIFMYLTKSYMVFLVIKLVCRIIENIIVAITANKMYPFIKEKNVEELDTEIKQSIVKNIKALFLHKIAGFIVSGTDTVLMSIFFGGLVTVAQYSNYNLVIAAATTILNQFMLAVTASVGNLLTEGDKNKNYSVYKKLSLLNFVIFLIGSSMILAIIEPFITIAFGKQYILSKFILFSLIAKFFVQGMRRTLMAFKEAAGIFYVDRFIPILESLVNLIASVVLLKIFGLPGIFLGTVASTLLLLLYSYPKYVYTKLFNKKISQYYKELLIYFMCGVGILTLVYVVNSMFVISNVYLSFGISFILSVCVPFICIFIIFGKKEEYIYYINIIKNMMQKLSRKKRNG